jgi:O-glycosyl hydrolase
MIRKLLVLFLLVTITTYNIFGQTVSVNTQKKFQTVEGIGGALAMYENWFVACPNKAALYDSLFSGLELSFLRIRNDFEHTPGTASTAIGMQSEFVSEAHKRLGNSFKVLLTSWSPPPGLKSNGQLSDNGSGTLAKVNGLYNYAGFGSYWKRSLQQYALQGVIPDYLSIQNEPNWAYQNEAMLLDPVENTTNAGYGNALKAVTDSLKTLNVVKPKIIGAEPIGISGNSLQNYANNLDKTLLNAYATHLYSGSFTNPDGYLTDMRSIASTLPDKPIFMTEFDNLSTVTAQQEIDLPMYLAWHMRNFFVEANGSAYVHWALAWGNGGGMVQVWNPWDKTQWQNPQGFTIKPMYYAFKQFTKFIKTGWVRIDATTDNTGLRTVAFQSPDGNSVSVVVINTTQTDIQSAFNLSTIQNLVSANIWQTATGVNCAKIGSWMTGNSIKFPKSSVTTISILTAANKPPVVNITAPANNTTFVSPANVSISAAASDIDGTIAKVDFYNGTTLIGSVASAPYNFNWANVATGTYTITAKATDNQGAVSSSPAISIVVNSFPTATITASGATTFCAGGNVTLSASTGSSYKWFNGSTLVGTASTYIASTSGTYTVQIPNMNTSAVTTVTVNTLPVITLYTNIDALGWQQVPGATVCAGSALAFGPWPTVATGWSWKGPNNFSSSIRDPQLSAISVIQKGIYTATYIDGNGCKASADFTLDVSVPTATITAVSNTTFCMGGNVSLTANAGTSYKWFNGSNQVATTASYTATAGGSYTVEVTNSNSCKNTSAVTTVTVNALPVINLYSNLNALGWQEVPGATVCAGSTLAFGPWPTVATGWSWKGPNNFSSSIRDPQLSAISSIQRGIYTATYIDGNGCKANADFTLDVSVPTATITAGSNTTFCTGGNVTLTANAGTYYKWFNGSNQVATTASYKATAGGSYTVEVTNSNSCKNTSSATTVTVNTCVVTGIPNQPTAESIQIFPNPFQNSFTIATEQPFQYTILSIVGKEMASGTGENAVQISENLPAGIYMLRIQTLKGTLVVKMVKN